MKFLLYIPTMTKGGAERVMSVIANEFANRGHEIILVNDFRDQSRLPCYHVAQEVKRLYLADENKRNKIIKNIIRIRKLRRIAKSENPDVILSFMGRPNQTMLMATKGLRSKKVVSVRVDPNREYGVDPIRRAWVNWLFQRADAIVFQTEDAMDYFNNSIKRKSSIILNPIDKSFYATKRPTEVRDVVAVGRLDKQKNDPLLIRAFAKVAGEHPDDNLVIYGEGTMREQLEDLIKQLGMESRIVLAGSVDDVAGVLSKAKIFVLASDYEGLPNALMEAMAVGVPCIATDCPCGGPRELIDNGINGILVPVDNEDALAEAMRRLLDDSGMRERIATKSKSRAEDFKAEKIIDKWEKVLLENLEAKNE